MIDMEEWEKTMVMKYSPAVFKKKLNRVPRDYYKDLVRKYKAKTFLDVGCGPGLTYEVLKRHWSLKYTGVDFMPAMINFCKENFPKGTFIEGSALNLPFEDQSFDMVTCRHMLEHVIEVDKVISEMGRAAKNHVVIVWVVPPNKELTEHQMKRWKGGVNNRYSYNLIIDSCKKAGLKLVSTGEGPIDPRTSKPKDIYWVLKKDNQWTL